MANRYDIIHIDFQASARGANAAIESIRKEAESCNNRITELKKNIAEAPKDTDAKILEGWNQELKVTDRKYRQLTQAQKELMKGMRALDEGVKMFNDGSLSAMNAAFQKTVNNAAKLAQSKLTTGTKEWRQMGALMQETEQNYSRMMRDTDQLVESLQNGGVVFRKTLEDEKKGLQDLLQVLPYMGTEYRKVEEQLQFLVKTTDEMATKERQLKGEIVTTDDARRVSLQLTKEGAEAAKQRAAAADIEIEKGKKEIETLEKEREVREKNARESAQAAAEYRENQQMYENEIDRLQKEIKADEERAASGRTGVEAMRRKAESMGKLADKEVAAQKKIDEAYEKAKGVTASLREEVEKLKKAAGSAPAVHAAANTEKTSAEETAKAKKEETASTKETTVAKKEEAAAVKETTAAKKEEVQVEEQSIKTENKENLTVEELMKKAGVLREKYMALLEERKKLEIAQNSGAKTITEEAAAVEKEANAFANLTKEQAQALLQQKQMQSTISKGSDGKFAYSNAEEAQNFLIESMRQANPANAKGDAMSLDSTGVSKVRAMFKERYGLQSDEDTLAAIRGLLSGESGGLIKGGMMNNAFSRIDLNPAKVSAYAKEVKDLTAVVNDETEATKAGTKAVEENAKAKRTLADVDAEYEATTKEVREIMRLVHKMQDGEIGTTEKLTDKTEKLAESHKKNAEAIKDEVDSIKQMNREQAEAIKKEMTTPSTIGYKAGKLDASNLEEVQHFLLTQISKRGVVGKDGTYSLAGQNVDTLLTAFQNKYGLSGKKQEAKQILKELAAGKNGGLFQEGGIIDFNNETMLIKANTEAYQGRIQKLKALINITNGTAQAVEKSTEATKKDTDATMSQTDAIKAQEEEVKRRRTAFEKKNEDYEAKNAKLKEMRSALGRLPKSGPDAGLMRYRAEEEIKEYNENVVKPARADKTKLKGLWEKSVKDLLKIQGQDTEETKKNTEAENQNTEATEKSAKGKRGKAKASEEAVKTTSEDTQKSAELLAKEKELKAAEDAEAEALKNKEAQQKRTTKAVEDAEAANDKAKQSEADLVKALDEKGKKLEENKKGLENLNKANKDTIATNEENQKLLSETNTKIQEQGEKIRDAERIKAQAKTDGIEKTEQAIRLLTEENRHIDQNSFTWKRNTIEIQHMQEALDEMKGKPALMMMEQRMKNIGALSASALEETRRFWDTMAAGAEKGSDKLATAEANVKALVEEERKRSEEKASKVIGNMGNFSDKEISDAVRTFEQLRDAQTHGNEEWTKFNNLVQQGKQHLEELAKQDALTKMEANMSNLTTLSDAARAETKKFFETLKAGAEKGSDELTKAETHLKAIKDLEKGENEAKAKKLLTGTLSNFSESEIREYIDAAQAFRKELASGDPAAQRYADAIAKAEAHVKKYGVEAARAAQQQADSNKLMQDQLNRIISDKQFGIAMPTASQLKAQKQYWQRLIDDPKTAASSLQQFRDRLAEVEQLEKEMVEINGKTAFQWFDDGKDRDASGNQIKEMADKLKEYRGTLLQETNAAEIQQIDSFLQRIGASTKKATEELMDFEKAKELALQAGDDVYGKKYPAFIGKPDTFLASPEEIQAATKSIEKYREELFKTIKQKRDMGEATDAEEQELKELAKYLKDLKFEQDNFNMSREKMEALMKTPVNATSIDELRAAIKRADAELKRMEGSLDQNSDQYKAFAEQVKNAKNTLKEMEGQAKASATAWEKAWNRLKTYVVMYMGFNAVWQKVMGTADDLMELSDKMGEVRKTTNLTEEAVGELSRNLAKLDVRTPLTELMSISAAAGQLGLKTTEDIQGFTEAANKLMIALPEMGKEAATEMMRVAIATGEVDKIRKQLQEGTIEGSSATAVAMEKIASTIDRLRASSASTAPEITDFVKRLGAVGAQSGISIDQVAALGSTISSLGMRVEMSATALSRMIPAIKNNAFAIANAIGVAPEALRSLFEAGRGMEAILMIFQHLKDQNANADTIESLLGIGNMKDVMKQLNQQGARAGIVFAGLSQNVDELRKQLVTANQAYEENIAIQQEFDRMNDTTAAKWERLKNRLEEMFVGDTSQSFLGGIISLLDDLVKLIADTGPIATGIKTLTVTWGALKLGIGEGIKAMALWFWNLSTNMTKAAASLKAFGAANWVGALVTAVTYLAFRFYEWSKSMNVAASEMAKLDAEITQQTEKADKLFRSLAKTNEELSRAKTKLEEVTKADKDATEAESALKKVSAEHAATIRDINSKYGTYLGYMLSETSSAEQLARARELINAKLRETITLKQQEAALGSVEQEFGGKVNKRATSMESTVNSLFGNNYEAAARVSVAISEAAQNYAKDSKQFEKVVRKIFADNFKYVDKKSQIAKQYGESVMQDRLTSIVVDNAEDYREAIEEYTKQEDAVNRRFQARININRKKTREATVRDLNAILTDWKDVVEQYRKAEGDEKEKLAVEVYKQQRAYANAVANNAEYFEGDKRMAVYEKNIKNMQTYEAGLRKVAGEAIRTVDAMERAETKVTGTDFTNGGDSATNPWGSSHDAASIDWKNMTANQLVERRKQMKEFVNAIQTDTDVQSVLKEDAALKKAIENGMSSDMRTVIEWYNTERLKIQDELHARHLTNTGEWMDPKKQRGAHKQFRDEMDAYLHELDAYYTERKTRIEEAGTDEGLTEAEIKNRTLNNEMEWQQRRAELQKLYSRKQKEVTEEELNAIYHIIAERTGDSEKFVKAQIAKTNQFVDSIEKSGEKGAAIVHRWMSQVELDTERSYLKGQQALTKQMRAIEAIIDKERPFNGITKNLQENLATMDILTGYMRNEYNELMKKGADMTKFNERQRLEELRNTTFMLGEAENAYSTTIDHVMDDMRQNGMTAWADWLSADPKLQEALMAQLRSTYDSIQDAIKKEASQLKKQAEIMWNNILMPDGKTTLKDAADRAIAQLSLNEGRVSRANSLIGAGQASERVADKLAIKQMQLQLTMQEHYYNLMKLRGQAAVDMLNAQAKAARERHDYEEATRKELDAQHAQQALNLATAKEETELAKQREEIVARTEDSQNRLYKELREWASLLSSSIQGVFEASHAGDAEYYNELAKMRLTGKGGPGAGTYIVIDNEGTEDATAHYEYLNERQALERQHEIERENAQAEAWKKVWDDINNKIAESITDQLNAYWQNKATEDNTAELQKLQTKIDEEKSKIDGNITATDANTVAVKNLTEQLAQGITIKKEGDSGGIGDNATNTGTEFAADKQANYPSAPVEGGTGLQVDMPAPTGDFATDKMAYYNAISQAANAAADAEIEASSRSAQSIINDSQKITQTETSNNTKIAKSNSSMFAKMTQASNLYGIAYQAMANDNLDTAQKFEMIALQAAGQAAISGLEVAISQMTAETAVNTARTASEDTAQHGSIIGPILTAISTAVLGGLMGLATSKIAKSKSQIASITGASIGAGRLSTGMLTYAEGNVNEFTDPSSLTPGRSYNVDAADGRTYRAKYTGTNPSTHITNGPEFHLSGEKGREMIIDAGTTRQITMNENEIWRTIKTLSGGGRISSRRTVGHGMRAFADGNLDDFEEVGSTLGDGTGAFSPEMLEGFQQSLDRNSAVMEQIAQKGIKAVVSPYGPDGIVAGYDKAKKEARRHGESYL